MKAIYEKEEKQKLTFADRVGLIRLLRTNPFVFATDKDSNHTFLLSTKNSDFFLNSADDAGDLDSFFVNFGELVTDYTFFVFSERGFYNLISKA